MQESISIQTIVGGGGLLAAGFALQWAYTTGKQARAQREEREKMRSAVTSALIQALHDMKASNEAKTSELIAALKDVVESNAKLAAKLEPLTEIAKAPDLVMGGVGKACAAIATTTEKLRLTVSRFAETVFGPGAGKDQLTVPTEAESDRAYTEALYRAAGKTPEEAATLAENDAIKNDSIYPSA